MRREHWIIPESNLLIEKYSKVINLEHMHELDGHLIAQLDTNRTMLHLVDFSDATFFNMDYGDLPIIFNGLLNRLGDTSKVRIALYSGENDKDDYMKVSAFSKYENSRVQMKNFVELIDAVKWLELSQDDRENVWKKLGILL